MSILDSKTGRIRKTYNLKQLEKAANYMRGLNLIAIHNAGSGHSGGTLSIMDITVALYLKVANHDPQNPNWEGRDRIIWSAGHKAPALYTALCMCGYCKEKDFAIGLRKYGTPFQGHPHWLKLAGVEVSSGSLGQGLGIGVGIALAFREKSLTRLQFPKVYVITGDGEWQEGSMWEAAMSASNYALNNLIVVVDRNYLQIDGDTEDVMKLDPMEKRLASFGFEIIKINGHKMSEILAAFEKAKKAKKPVAIIAKTIKGRGVSFMENIAGWHGKAPDLEQLNLALKELRLEKDFDVTKLKKLSSDYQKKVDEKVKKLSPRFRKDYFWNKTENMKVVMEPTRFGFGRGLFLSGRDKRVVCLGLDISESVQISKFYDGSPERKNRFLSMGIAEQNATVVAAGLAKEGKIPVLSTYGVFCSQRNADQMRTSVCYGNFNVFFAGAHGGISVGADGATHQSLEEISVVGTLPNMNLVVPCDSIETQKATEFLLLKLKGPKYLRFAREATPVVTDAKTPFVFGRANIIRYRVEKANFKNAFETVLAKNYKDVGESVAIIACGPEVPEAMRAAWILAKEYGIKSRVLNIHTVKPLDKEAILQTAREVEVIVTAEEHQKGGFGNLIAGTIMEGVLPKVPKMAMIGVQDRFGESGAPWELMRAFGLLAENIVERVLGLIKS